MQLFSIGRKCDTCSRNLMLLHPSFLTILIFITVYKLKIDGTLDLDENGQAQLSYTDEDIRKSQYIFKFFLLCLPL